MRKPQGYAQVVNPDGGMRECDTITCSHCNCIKFVPTGRDTLIGQTPEPTDLGFCRVCMKNICGPCVDQGHCIPFEKKIEQHERRAKLLRAITG